MCSLVIIVSVVQSMSIIIKIDMQGSRKSNHKNQKQPSQNIKESLIKCKHCGRLILSNNYLIHQARCTLMSSRVQIYQNEQKLQHKQEESPQISFVSKTKREQIRPSCQHFLQSDRKGAQKQSKKSEKQEQIQRIPCPFCGYAQALAELDTHPQQCEHRQQPCPYCGNNFPRSLMQQHIQICINNQPTQQQNRNSRRQMSLHQQEDNYNPFGNFRNWFFSPMIPPQNNMRRTGYAIIQSSDSRGNVHRQVIMGQPPGSNRNFTNQNTQSLSNFFAILQFMAGRHALGNQGLTKGQIKNLKRFTYHGNNSNNKQSQKDLCTICYCQFEIGQKLVELKCKHAYHEQCITKWIQKTAKCPVCKAAQTNRPIFQEQQKYF